MLPVSHLMEDSDFSVSRQETYRNVKQRWLHGPSFLFLSCFEVKSKPGSVNRRIASSPFIPRVEGHSCPCGKCPSMPSFIYESRIRTKSDGNCGLQLPVRGFIVSSYPTCTLHHIRTYIYFNLPIRWDLAEKDPIVSECTLQSKLRRKRASFRRHL